MRVMEVMSKHPESTENVKTMFGEARSEFRIISDDLLQLVCGKRAKLLDLQRNYHSLYRLCCKMFHCQLHVYFTKKSCIETTFSSAFSEQ